MDLTGAANAANPNCTGESIRREIELLRAAVSRELCGMRHDIDILQRGGWEVKIGAFQPLLQPDMVSVQGIQERMLGESMSRLQVVTSDNGNTEGAALEAQRQSMERPKATPRKKPLLSKTLPGPDEAIASIEDPAAATRSVYAPLTVRQLSPLMSELASAVTSAVATQSFSAEFIHDLFGGGQWSPGYYFISKGACVLSSRAYYGLDAYIDPFLPPAPGKHGAKLVPFIRNSTEEDDPDEKHLLDVPMFVRSSDFAKLAGKPNEEYVYFGNYSQLRFSDRLDYDSMIETIPHDVKMYWAEQLSDTSRPLWVTNALMAHFEKKPEFDVKSEQVKSDIEEFAEEMRQWQSDGIERTRDLTKEDILKAFESADCADPPGLRLWWEYLQCVGYDEEFYKCLVRKQETWRKH